MKRTHLLLAFSLLAVATAEPASAAATKPLGTAGKVTVSQAEAAAYLRAEGGQGTTLEKKRELVTKLLVRKALARDAESRGLGKDPLLEHGLLQWKLRHYPDFYWQQEAAKVTISDEQLRAHVKPRERVLLSAIVLGLDSRGRADALEVVDLLAAGGDFAQLARERSLGHKAALGGDFGWNELPNLYVEEKETQVINATAVGSWTAPLETRIGWVIFLVRARKSPDDVFAEEKERAKAALLPDLIAERKAKRLAELRDKARIVYPAEKAIPGAGAPLAIIDGYAVSPAALNPTEEQHNFNFKSIVSPQQQLQSFINAFVVVREMEKRGLDKDAGLKQQFSFERIKILSQLLLRAEAEKRVVVSEADLKAQYQHDIVPEVYALEMIVGRDPSAMEAALAAVRGGESFDAAVERLGRNGDLKSVGSRGPIVALHPEVRRVIETLPDGGISGVLDNAAAGLIIVKRLSMQRVTPPTYEAAADSLRARLLVKRRAEFLKDFVERYGKQLKIDIDDEQLRAL